MTHEQLPLDFSVSATVRMRKAKKALDKVESEQPKLFNAPPNIDIHLHSPLEAVAQISGGDPDRAIVWLSALVGSVRVIKSKRVAFATEALDRLLHIRPPAHVTLDAASLAVARALWAHKLELKPLTVTRHSQRLLATSPRWPTALRVTDAPWTAIATLVKLKIPLTIEPKARQLMTTRLASTGAHVATAGLAGSAVILEATSPTLLENMGLPGLSYAGEPMSGTYKMPLLLADRLLKEQSIRVSHDLQTAIKKASVRVKPLQTKETFPWTLYNFQARDAAQALRILETTGGTLLAGDMGSGKSAHVNSKVLAKDGWLRYGDIKVGDQVYGSDGELHNVVGVFPQGVKSSYRVTMSDGSYADTCDEHYWGVRRKTKAYTPAAGPLEYMQLKEIMKDLRVEGKSGFNRFVVPLVAPINYPYADLPLDPYALGALIGDGLFSGNTPGFCAGFEEMQVVNLLAETLPDNVEMRLGVPSQTAQRWNLVLKDGGKPYPGLVNPVRNILKDLELWGLKSFDKFIPEIYSRASIEQRTALLQGLMDTDGRSPTGGAPSLKTSSPHLRDQVVALVRSLGGLAKVATVAECVYVTPEGKSGIRRENYNISMRLPEGIMPFRMKSKLDAYLKAFSSRRSVSMEQSIVKVERLEDAESVCISVDSDDHLYVTDNHILVRNTTVSLALADTLNSWPLLVVAPLSAFSTWDRQLREMGKKTYLATEAPAKCWEAIEGGGYDVVVVSYDRLHAFTEVIETYGFQSVIADELQRIRTPGSRRSRALRQLALSIPIRIGLSGTPLTNKLDDLLPLGSFLAPSEWRPRASSKDLDDMYPGDPIESIADHLGALMVRRRMEDTGATLPKRKDHRVVIQLTPEQRAALAALEAEAEAAKSGGEFDDPGSKMHAFVRLQRMRQIINSPSAAGVPGPNPKISSAIDLAEDFLAQGRKGVIFCADRTTFRDIGKALDEANIGWVGIWGSTPPMDRITNEKKFHENAIAPNGNPTSIVLCTIQAGAESWSASPTATWLISTAYVYAPSTLSQMEARVYRMNSDINGPDIEICYIHANAPGGSLDDRMVEILEIKKHLFAQVIDRRAHVDSTQVHYSMADLVFLLTGKHDDKLAKREADAKAAVKREQDMKRHAKVTAHKNKGANKRSSDYHDDGSMAKTLEEMLSLADLDETSLDIPDASPIEEEELEEMEDFDVEEGDDEE